MYMSAYIEVHWKPHALKEAVRGDGIPDACYHQRPAVAAYRVLEHARELGVT